MEETMTLVNLDDEIYEQVKIIIEKTRPEYANLKNFVDRAVKEKIKIDMIRHKEAEIKRRK